MACTDKNNEVIVYVGELPKETNGLYFSDLSSKCILINQQLTKVEQINVLAKILEEVN